MRQIGTTTNPCKNCGGTKYFIDYSPGAMTFTCVSCRLKQVAEEEE